MATPHQRELNRLKPSRRIPKTPKLETVLEVRTGPDGQLVEVTTCDRIIGYMRAGASLQVAAAAANVHRRTLYGWLSDGAAVQSAIAAMEAGDIPRRRLNKRERLLVRFAAEAAQATAQAEVRMVGLMAKLASGEGLEASKTTERYQLDPQGNEVLIERSTVTNDVLPSESAVAFMLTHRFGWSKTEKIETSTPAGQGSVGSPTLEKLTGVLEGLAEKIDAAQRVVPVAAIEAEAHEVEPQAATG